MEYSDCILSVDGDLPPCDERIAALLQYWRSIRPDSAKFPGRQHFDPVAIPKLLPWIWLMDVQRAPLRFRFRVMGTEQTAFIGDDPTGRWVDERFPNLLTKITYRHFVACAERGAMTYQSPLPVAHVDKRYMSSERICLPMARNGHDIDMVLAMSVFHPTVDAAAALPQPAVGGTL